MKRFIILFFFLCCCLEMAYTSEIPGRYRFTDEPIDVVIPSSEKDLETLNLCIAGIRANCSQVRRVIVVSSHPLTDQAEWFDEAAFPFDKAKIAFHLLKGNMNVAEEHLLQIQARQGWYFQQLLKLYASFVIPDISSNVLILDSDVIFLNPVEFLDDDFSGLYSTSYEYCPAYFEHAKTFLPGLERVFPNHSGIAHHMLFQRSVLEDLFIQVESYHEVPLWQAFCNCVNLKDLFAGASEYEIYFNFVFSMTDQVHIRNFKWTNLGQLNLLDDYKSRGYLYVACHHFLRN